MDDWMLVGIGALIGIVFSEKIRTAFPGVFPASMNVQSMYGEFDNAIDVRRREGMLDGEYAAGGPQQPVDFRMMSMRRQR